VPSRHTPTTTVSVSLVDQDRTHPRADRCIAKNAHTNASAQTRGHTRARRYTAMLVCARRPEQRKNRQAVSSARVQVHCRATMHDIAQRAFRRAGRLSEERSAKKYKSSAPPKTETSTETPWAQRHGKR
jgi:hypothetical protein